MSTPVLGNIVQVTFYDHVRGDTEPFPVTVFGRLVKDEEEYVVVCSWEQADQPFEGGHNEEFFTLLRSTFIDYKILTPKEATCPPD